MSAIHNQPSFPAPEGAIIAWYRQFFEVLVFLFLIVPSLAFSFAAAQQGGSFDLIAWATILRDLSLVSLVAFLLWRDGEPVRRIGWTARRAGLDIAMGIALFVPLLVLTSMLGGALQELGLSGSRGKLPAFLTPKGSWQLVLAVVLIAVVAVAEETIFRGYLILRSHALTRSRTAAVILSSIIFSVGHGYEGAAGVITVGVLGLAFAIVYLWRRSLTAAIVMHFLQDFIGIVLLPLLAHK